MIFGHRVHLLFIYFGVVLILWKLPPTDYCHNISLVYNIIDSNMSTQEPEGATVSLIDLVYISIFTVRSADRNLRREQNNFIVK